jgi:hypothetical protein
VIEMVSPVSHVPLYVWGLVVKVAPSLGLVTTIAGAVVSTV